MSTINLSDSDIPYNYEYNTKTVAYEIILKNTVIDKDIGYPAGLNEKNYINEKTPSNFFKVDGNFLNSEYNYIISTQINPRYVLNVNTNYLANGVYEFVFFVDSLDNCGSIKFLRNSNGLNVINSELNNASITSSTSSIQISFQESVIELTDGTSSTTNTLTNTNITINTKLTDQGYINDYLVVKYKINKI
jgi:hypothetical protein